MVADDLLRLNALSNEMSSVMTRLVGRLERRFSGFKTSVRCSYGISLVQNSFVGSVAITFVPPVDRVTQGVSLRDCPVDYGMEFLKAHGLDGGSFTVHVVGRVAPEEWAEALAILSEELGLESPA